MPEETQVDLRSIGSEEIVVNSQATGTGSRRFRRWAYVGFFAFSILAWAAAAWLAYIWLASP
jgi:hypothetical protein